MTEKDCLDCGHCPACIERSIAHAEEAAERLDWRWRFTETVLLGILLAAGSIGVVWLVINGVGWLLRRM